MNLKKEPTWILWAVLFVAVAYLGYMAIPRGEGDDEFQFSKVASLPVQDGGRIKPFDTLARVRLMQISHSQRLVHIDFKKDPANPEGEIVDKVTRISPTKWAFETMVTKFADTPAFEYRVFRIDNDQVVNFLKLPIRPGSWLYSWNEFADNPQFREQVKRIIYEQEGPEKGNLFDNKIAELWGQVVGFLKLAEMDLRLVHPDGGRRQRADDHWLPLEAALQQAQQGAEHKTLDHYRNIIAAYSANKPREFNKAVAGYQEYLETARPDDYHSARLETFFNRFDPFMHCMILYGLVFVLGAFSWLGWPRTLQKAAFWLAVLLFAIHTWALITRIVLTGRPPVTNLYSSAVFIGWGCVGLCLFLEWVFKNGIGIVVAALTGMMSLIIARNLVSGDTMEMLQAVLDTNFWLATHVICITFGYTTMFVAGFLGILYVVLGIFTPLLRGQNGADLTKMIYGTTCFATLLSFVGTVLGGIWADESWGRFWGWDPKENGALLIVIWAALLLHARWGGIVKARGMANLAIFGNCVTLWSWFGTNMLGVGLHAYGGSGGLSAGALWVIGSVIFHLLIIGLGCLPLQNWKSFSAPSPPKETPTDGKAGMALAT